MAEGVVDVIRDLCRLLFSDAPSADRLAEQANSSGLFGEVEVDDEAPPELVELELADSASVTVDELAAAFGEPSPLPLLHPDRPSRVAFYVEEAGRPASVAVIASLADDEEEGGRVSAITLRRDERGDDD